MRGLVAARKMIGEQPENLLKLPTAGDADGLRSVLHKLGLPETPDAYTLQPVEGIAHDTDLAKAFTSAAFDAGILPQHAQAVFEKVGGFLKEFEAQQAQAVQNREHADMQALTAKFGSALDDTLARAEAVANHYGVTDAINEAGLGTNPAIVGLLSSVWPTIQEDSVGGRRDSSMGSVKTPEQYMAEARELQRQALSETVRSRQLELSTAASRLYQLANASRR